MYSQGLRPSCGLESPTYPGRCQCDYGNEMSCSSAQVGRTLTLPVEGMGLSFRELKTGNGNANGHGHGHGQRVGGWLDTHRI